MQGGHLDIPVLTVDGEQVEHRHDAVASEEPLAIRVVTVDGRRHDVAVTMRTPGADHELAIGFLVGEGVIGRGDEVETVRTADNQVDVVLTDEVSFDADALRRNVYATSSCGVCGRASLDHLHSLSASSPHGESTLTPDMLRRLPTTLRTTQDVFGATGGLHAAALFTAEGTLRTAREDVGRHNAADKVIGRAYLDQALPADDMILLLSGRASWELMQKALLAGIPTVAAVGAPSSLAVALARRFGQTLIGFLRGRRFNVYSGAERLDLTARIQS
ncbi:MAG: formate dehydrogenase accessory sulfurtransferase FdhD [Acidobacteriota bacterium]